MDEILNVIKKRRSIREYKKNKVERNKMEKILEAGIYAPSGMNNQSWKFIVLTEDAVLEKVRVTVRDYFRNLDTNQVVTAAIERGKTMAVDDEYSFFYHAPDLVIVTNENDYMNQVPDSIGAIQNMLIEATGLGIASCWINQLTWLCKEKPIYYMLRDMGMPSNHSVCGAIALGYTDVEASAAPRKENCIIWK